MTTSALATGSSCSQNLSTAQPPRRSLRSVSRSRSTFFRSFSVHHSFRVPGVVAWSGHACQKQPSTKTASRARVKTTSPRRRGIPGSRWSTRNLRPARCSSARRAISGAVSLRRCRDIRDATAASTGPSSLPAPVWRRGRSPAGEDPGSSLAVRLGSDAMTTVLAPSSVQESNAQHIRVLDLFAGVGGLSEGFRSGDSRYRTERAVEMEPRAAAGYALNHGDRVYTGSIQDWLLEEDVPEVDLVIGGPPCQGFSALGARRVDDERNVLWRHYAEAVVMARPRYFVLENVPQFGTSSQYEMFHAMTEKRGPL